MVNVPERLKELADALAEANTALAEAQVKRESILKQIAEIAQSEELPGESSFLSKRILDELRLPRGMCWKLKDAEVKYVGDLVQLSESAFLRIPYMGRKGLQKVKDALALHNLHLDTTVRDWNRPEV